MAEEDDDGMYAEAAEDKAELALDRFSMLLLVALEVDILASLEESETVLSNPLAVFLAI